MNPAMLAWASLIAVAVALYLFRRRPRTVRVTTLPFFQALAREHQESSWLRKLKRLLSLLLSILIIAALTGALAGLVWAPASDSVRSVVIVIDTSASMNARDDDDRTRLDVALQRAEARLAGLTEGVPVAVVAYDRRPRILVPPTLNRRQVRAALERIEARPIAGQQPRALALAERLAAMRTPAAIWHFTDAPESQQTNDSADTEDAAQDASAQNQNTNDSTQPTPATEAPAAPAEDANGDGDGDDQITTRTFAVGLPRPVNVGITAFDMRPLPLQKAKYAVFVQFRAQSPEPIDVQLNQYLSGRLVQTPSVTLEPGAQQSMTFEINAGSERTLTLEAVADGDALQTDNLVHARVPEVPPVRVAWITPQRDPFMQLALNTLSNMGDIEVYPASPDEWPIENEIDVALFDGWAPERLPDDVGTIVTNPPTDVDTIGPVGISAVERGSLPIEHLRVTNDKHPLLYGVATPRIKVSQSVVMALDRRGGAIAPLWTGPVGPVLAAGHYNGQRIALLAFEPTRSERFPLMASFPLLLGNALYWSSEPAMQQVRPRQMTTGELVEVSDNEITWTTPTRGNDDADDTQRVNVPGRWAELDRVGLWDAGDGRDGSAALLSARETLLPAMDDANESDDAASGSWLARWLSGDLTVWCVVLALGVLMIESWLFHRHAVY